MHALKAFLKIHYKSLDHGDQKRRERYLKRAKGIKNKKGELVCKKPFPSMPVKFWGDTGGEKYHKAYFTKFKNI